MTPSPELALAARTPEWTLEQNQGFDAGGSFLVSLDGLVSLVSFFSGDFSEDADFWDNP